MSVNELIEPLLESLVRFSSTGLVPTMILTFSIGMMFRLLIFYTTKRHEWFAKEFEKRVDRWGIDGEDESGPVSFFGICKKLLEKTYYEIFETRAKLSRRKPDRIMSMSDRIFLIKQGSAWLIRDTLKQVKHLKYSEQQPKLLSITKSSFQSNPCFNQLFGLVPISAINDILNVLPGLFVIGGIFGTFLGIMKGLPELSGMNLSDLDQTKLVMDQFLVNISFSMHTSIVGILFSVCTSIINTVFNPEKIFVSTVDRFENSLDVLWNRADNNDSPRPVASEDRDPVEALAEEALNMELERTARTRSIDKVRPPTKGKNAS